MNIEKLKRRKGSENNTKLSKAYLQIEGLIGALNKRELKEKHIKAINIDIALLNKYDGSDKELIKQLKKAYNRILEYIEKELELVAKHHYQNKWMVFGMIGGVILSYLFKAIEYSATWNSIGFAISMGLIFGLLAGKNRDEKARKDGNQLEY